MTFAISVLLCCAVECLHYKKRRYCLQSLNQKQICTDLQNIVTTT